MVEQYIGPVLYVTHAPYLTDFEHPKTKLSKGNIAKIEYSLKLAAQFGIPVIYEISGAQSKKEFDRITNSLKKKPRIVTINFSEKFFKKPELDKKENEIKIVKTTFERENINPTTLIFTGQQRNICVENSIKNAKRAFPKARLILVKGAYSVLEPIVSRETRTKIKKELKKMDIETTKSLSGKKMRRIKYR